MKKTLPVLIILIVIFISGCTQIPEVKNCVRSKPCFLDATEVCSPAKVKFMDSKEFSDDVQLSVTFEAEIEGLEGDDCAHFLKLKEINFNYNQESLSTDSLDLISDIENLEASEMTCSIPVSQTQDITFDELNAHFDEWCEGTYKTLLDQLQQKILEKLETAVSKTFMVPIGGSYCTDGTIKISLTNTGLEALTTDDFIIEVDDVDASGGLEGDIDTGDTGQFSWDCEGFCSPGSHTIDITTISEEREVTVQCV